MDYILILGANSDIAKKISFEYAKKNYNLYLCSRRCKELNLLARKLKSEYKINVKVIEFDAFDYARHKDFYYSLYKKPIGVGMCSRLFRFSKTS